MKVDVEQHLRAQLRKQLRVIVPAAHVEEIIDLAFHAAHSAMETAERILNSASDHRIGISASAPAFGLLAGFAGLMVDGIREDAAKAGMGIREFTIKGPGQ